MNLALAKLGPALLAFSALVFARNPHHRYEWSHSLYAPYISIDGRNSNWDFDALVSMHDFVQLTPEMPQKSGWAFTKEPLEADNWAVDFFFRISGAYPADGMAFWFSEKRFEPGSAFGYKENFKGLGVFLDVWKNHGGHHPHPWISAMVGDGIKRFNHDTDGHEFAIGGCHQEILNTNHPVHARVVYNKKELEVSFKHGEGDWKTCFRVADIKLPKKGFIGFTASTGGLAARHDLLAVTTAVIENDPTQSYNVNQMMRTSHVAPRAFLVLFAISGFFGIGAYLYQNNIKRHNF